MIATEQHYRHWQNRLQKGDWYKWWWQFWSNYSWLLILPIFVYIYFNLQAQVFVTEVVIAFVISRLILVPIVSWLFPQARPYQKYKFPPVTSIFLSRQTSKLNSFPSSHVISIMAACGVILLISSLLGVLMLIIGLMTGWGRVVLGYHYPKDVVFSVIFGLIIGIVTGQLV